MNDPRIRTCSGLTDDYDDGPLFGCLHRDRGISLSSVVYAWERGA